MVAGSLSKVLCTEIKTKEVRPVCPKCNICFSGHLGSKRQDGTHYYRTYCTGCYHEQNHGKRHPFKKSHKYQRPWIIHKKSSCERCGFIPIHPCQLDVDHIDGNKKHNTPDNYQTLCSNCHRLKTFLNGDSNGKKKIA